MVKAWRISKELSGPHTLTNSNIWEGLGGTGFELMKAQRFIVLQVKSWKYYNYVLGSGPAIFYEPNGT